MGVEPEEWRTLLRLRRQEATLRDRYSAEAAHAPAELTDLGRAARQKPALA